MAQSLRENQHGIRASGHGEPDEEFEDASRLSADNDAEKVKLYMPSQLPTSLWSTGCMLGLHEIELKLRVAQTSDALEQLKQHLCIYSSFVRYKIKQVSGPGQKANTRAHILLQRFREKITQSAERYRVSRAALELLDPKGVWQEQLKPLLESDVQGPNGKSPHDVIAGASKRSKGTGEGVRELSWIWRVRRIASHSITEGLAGTDRSSVNSEAELDKCKSSYFQDLLR